MLQSEIQTMKSELKATIKEKDSRRFELEKRFQSAQQQSLHRRFSIT